MNKIVYLPIEIKSRDFQNKLLLTYFLTLKGFNVFLGRKKEIETLAINYFPGIYFGVNTHKAYLKFYKKIIAKKNKLFLFDEEGLVTLPDTAYVSTKATSDIINISDQFFCWGKKQLRKILLQKKIDKKKLILSGSLRIELLKKRYDNLYKSEVNEIKKKYKNVRLLISSYGNSNHYLKKKNSPGKFLNKKLFKKKVFVTYMNYFNFNKKRFKNFLNCLNKEKKNSVFQTIVRPHPSEDYKYYNDLSKKKNFLINRDTSIIAWMKASKIIVHDYCTTSFEASVLKKKIFYLPLSFKNNNFKLEKDVYKLSNKLTNKIKLKKNRDIDLILKNHIYNYKKISSLNVILNSFDKLRMKSINLNSNYKFLKSKFLLSYYSLRENKYTDLKTPFIKKNECLEFLNKIEKIEGKKNRIKINEFSKNVMLIKSN